jgi:hypothetical protein
MDDKWELTIAENAGEIPAKQFTNEVKVATHPLLTDVKAQLMVMPKTLMYTVGWRALVWQNKTTGQFKDISDEEYANYLAHGDVNGPAGDGENPEPTESTSGNEGDNTN